MKSILTVCVAALSLLVSCGAVEDVYKQDEAFVDLFVAVEAKRARCGAAPRELLFPFQDETPKFAVDACVFSILREPCPFTTYPAVCYEIYGIDIPFIGP